MKSTIIFSVVSEFQSANDSPAVLQIIINEQNMLNHSGSLTLNNKTVINKLTVEFFAG